MGQEWKSVYLDAVLVSVGMVMLLSYHARLAYRVWKAPYTTEIGLYHLALQAWAHSTLKDGLKNGIFVVQTMRNSIMSSSILATAAITMTTMLGIVFINDRRSLASGKADALMLGARGLPIGLQFKLAALVPCFFIASVCYARSATFYGNASLLLGMLSDQSMSVLASEHLSKALVWASLFRCVGTRAIFISIPLFLWLYGPMPMFCSSLITIGILHLQDSACHAKFVKPPLSTSPSPWNDQLSLEESPLIGIGPLPPDSVCLFCPHK
ncbi:hypothetical protein GOP47_0011540 [Adiantum capillus-veneris]|uniref:Uncharacterized protein n=1 Tax=Adiantum capillus-veneris TaxID=13818 RepID=A0A9D4UU85_ADICA|nr:hypothetical protein GOP47_0011540 [Adiantum capillus-veneris]